MGLWLIVILIVVLIAWYIWPRSIPSEFDQFYSKPFKLSQMNNIVYFYMIEPESRDTVRITYKTGVMPKPGFMSTELAAASYRVEAIQGDYMKGYWLTPLEKIDAINVPKGKLMLTKDSENMWVLNYGSGVSKLVVLTQ
jgi:hypothetical protein